LRFTPDFFIAGAPKAGTDALYYALDQHPQIYMSPLKEPCFFSSEIRVEHFEPGLRERMKNEADSVREFIHGPMTERRFGGIVSEWDDYLRLFAHVKDQKAVGEGSVCYLWSRTAAAAIASRLPKARIIIVLMDPAERAFAQYLKSVSDGTAAHSFSQHLDACFRRTDGYLGVLHPFLEFGMYARQVRRYTNVFPADQIHISLFDETLRDPRVWFSGILEFLGVDPTFVPEEVRGHYHPNLPRFVRVSQTLQARGLWKKLGQRIPKGLQPAVKRLLYRQTELITMQAEDRARLVEYYGSDIEELQRLLKKDLSHWLRV
jgi:Sulfotransferase family